MVERLRPTLRVAASQALVLAGYAALTVALTWPLAAHLGTHTVDVGVDDPLFYTRMVRHFFAWLAGDRAGVLDVDFFWPHVQALTTNDISLGLLYSTLPFRPFTSDLLALVNLGFLLTFVLTGHATWLLVRELSGNRAAAWVAGAAHAFCLFRFHQLDHLNVLQTHWGTYALFATVRLSRAPSWPAALGLSGALFLHGTASMNLALYSVFALTMLGLFVLVDTPAERRRRFLLLALGACVLAGAALYPLYKPYLVARERTGMKRELGEIQGYSGNVQQLAAAPPYNRLYGPTLSRYLARESMTFPGATVLALAALGAVLALASRKDGKLDAARAGAGAAAVAVLALLVWAGIHWRAAALALVLALLALGLWAAWRGQQRAGLAAVLLSVAAFYVFASFGPTVYWGPERVGPGVWEWMMALPGYSWVRTPARFVFETSFALSVLAGLALAWLPWGENAPRWAQWAASGAALACVLVEFNSAPLPLRKMRTLEQAPEVYRWLATQPGRGAVLELPAFHLFERYRMYFSTLHDRPTVDGESGYPLPVMAWVGQDSFRSGEAARHLVRLRGAGLEFIVLHTDQAQRLPAPYREVLSEAGATRVERFGRDEVWRLPPAERTVELTQDAVQSKLEPSGGDAARLELTWDLTPRADAFIFEHRERRFLARLEEAPAVRAPVFLSPPLLAPGMVERIPVSLPLPGPLPAPCTVELLDESGARWASGPCAIR